MTLPRATVLVTRPQPQADAWVARLREAGAQALALPLLRILPDEAFRPAVRQAWADLAAGRWALVMFVSPNAVLQFLAEAPPGWRWPAVTLAGATGPGTRAALLEAGVPAGCIAHPRDDARRFDAEALWGDALAARDWAGRSVLIVRGESGRDWLAETLRARGAEVTLLAAYRQAGPDWGDAVAAEAGAADGREFDPSAAAFAAPGVALAQCVAAARAGQLRPVWIFSSSRAIDHLAARLQAAPELAAARGWRVLATHPRIADTAHRQGFAEVQAVRPEPAEVAAAVQAG